jgi:PhoH-like ATPase
MYTGYNEITMNDEVMAAFYMTKKENRFDFLQNLSTSKIFPNSYVLIKNSNGEIVEKYSYRHNVLEPLTFHTIDSAYMGIIRPRNAQQELAIDLLQSDTPVKILGGVYGCGKDFLMAAEALHLVQAGKFDKIVFIRPNITVKDIPDIGALPGDILGAGLGGKLGWTLGPIYDKVGGEYGITQLLNKHMLEVVPLLHIRGRSFDNSIVYVTEAQNATLEIVKLILGRIGNDSELWINADSHQTDKAIFDKDNGVARALNLLKGNPLVGYVYMPITERSEVANLANILDNVTGEAE